MTVTGLQVIHHWDDGMGRLVVEGSGKMQAEHQGVVAIKHALDGGWT